MDQDQTTAIPPSQKAPTLARKFAALREEKAKHEEEIKKIEEELDMVGAELRTELEGLEAQRLAITGVGTVYLRTAFFARVVPGQEDTFLKWLDDRGMGALAPRKVHHQTLSHEYQEWMEGDKPVPPKEVVDVFSKVEVRLLKSKGEKK